MGFQTRTSVPRLMVLSAVLGAIALCAGCSGKSDQASTPTSRQSMIERDIMPASVPLQDPNKVPVEPPKAQPPRQLFSTIDCNEDGVIDEEELHAAYHCAGSFCHCDRELIATLYANRASHGHVMQTQENSRTISGTVTTGKTSLPFSTSLTSRSKSFGLTFDEFERFVESERGPATS